MNAARADHRPRATDGKGHEKAAALALSTEDGKFLLGHTPRSQQRLPLQGKERRKGMTLLQSVQSVVHPQHTHTHPHTDLPESLPCAGHPRGCCQQKVCVCGTSLAVCESFTQSKSLNDFAFNTLPFQFKGRWGKQAL